MATKRAAKRAGQASAGKLLGTLTAVTLVGVVGVVGTRAAISATTDNPGNAFNAGTITLSNNSAGSFMYNVNNALPGQSVEKCIQVSYTSSGLQSTVKLFMPTAVNGLAPYLDLKVDVGTDSSPTFPDCTNFTPTENIYSGTLSAFQAAHNSDTNGLAASPNGVNPWATGDKLVYRVTVTLQNATRQPGEDFSGTHTYTWQADSV